MLSLRVTETLGKNIVAHCCTLPNIFCISDNMLPLDLRHIFSVNKMELSLLIMHY
jgi:hypothetical protein